VLPGNVIIERGMDEGEANAIVAGVVWHRYQMPAYHLIAADGDAAKGERARPRRRTAGHLHQPRHPADPAPRPEHPHRPGLVATG
ncbi:hypothetical protein FLI59_34355, partial [Pseudomonas aeruginosa]